MSPRGHCRLTHHHTQCYLKYCTIGTKTSSWEKLGTSWLSLLTDKKTNSWTTLQRFNRSKSNSWMWWYICALCRSPTLCCTPLDYVWWCWEAHTSSLTPAAHQESWATITATVCTKKLCRWRGGEQLSCVLTISLFLFDHIHLVFWHWEAAHGDTSTQYTQVPSCKVD